MKKIYLVLGFCILTILSGCAADVAFQQVDKICDAEAKGKEAYRECLKREYLGLKEQIKSFKSPFSQEPAVLVEDE